VGEGAVVVVVIEGRRRARSRMAGPALGVDEQDVLPAVAVEVEERAARAHRLGKVLLSESTARVLEVDARRGADVGEGDGGLGGEGGADGPGGGCDGEGSQRPPPAAACARSTASATETCS